MAQDLVHRAVSRIRTGKTYELLHCWIDENKSCDSAGKNHCFSEELRQHVHDSFGGEEAVSEWLFHIAVDKINDSVMFDWKKGISESNLHKFGFEDNGFVHYREYNATDEQMEDEFSEVDET
ncbi:MAG: hypothetical protein V1702_06435 [Candidatus Woesearchaeota archaeon]